MFEENRGELRHTIWHAFLLHNDWVGRHAAEIKPETLKFGGIRWDRSLLWFTLNIVKQAIKRADYTMHDSRSLQGLEQFRLLAGGISAKIRRKYWKAAINGGSAIEDIVWILCRGIL